MRAIENLEWIDIMTDKCRIQNQNEQLKSERVLSSQSLVLPTPQLAARGDSVCALVTKTRRYRHSFRPDTIIHPPHAMTLLSFALSLLVVHPRRNGREIICGNCITQRCGLCVPDLGIINVPTLFKDYPKQIHRQRNPRIRRPH